MSDSWIVASARTPIGRFLGEYSTIPATRLGAIAIAGAVQRASLPGRHIDEVIMGQVLLGGCGQAPARQAAILSGLDKNIGCVTVNKVCGSGLYAVMMADRSIRSGDNQIVVAGGMENMSQAPHLLRNARLGWKFGSQAVADAIESDGLRCAYGDVMMGCYADEVARSEGIDRHAQDEWALVSHQRALAAQKEALLTAEIVPVPLDNGQCVSKDAGPRADTDLAKLARLKPAFDAKGTVTAGNSSSLSDGAAAMIVVSEAQRMELGHPVAFRIVASQVVAAEPKDLFIAPAMAIERLLEKTKLAVGNVDLFEINEAFASQTVACMRRLRIAPEKLNVHGGAIALGHPIGCSGARVLVTLMHALVTKQKRLGVASLCLGGGEAVAMMIETHTTP